MSLHLQRQIDQKEAERRALAADVLAARETIALAEQDAWVLLDRVIDAAFPEGYKVPTDPIAAGVYLGELRGMLRHLVEARTIVEHDDEVQRQIDVLQQRMIKRDNPDLTD